MFKTLIKGTFILTIMGLVTRIIGFIYKIYLSNLMETRLLGIYQLIFPIYGICFTLFGAGIQTAVSGMIAASPGEKNKHKKILYCAFILSSTTSVVLSVLIYFSSDYVACKLLGEPECGISLRYLIYAFPVCGISSCVNGYYYGLKKAGVPAITQLIEQLARVAFVVLFSSSNKNICIIAITGICVGETISMLYSIVMLVINIKKEKKKKNGAETNDRILLPLLKLSIPLTANKLIIALLNSLELVMIPVMLKKYGLNSEESLSIFGILTGMAIPFILFPSTITNSLAVLLLPTISEANISSVANVKRISSACIFGSIMLGMLSTVLFLLFGAKFGAFIFHNETVGIFIQILSFLCPFLFLLTTLTSIINGLGKTHITFMITALSLSIRIILTQKLVPEKGISGYLLSLLISQLMATALSYKYYKKLI